MVQAFSLWLPPSMKSTRRADRVANRRTKKSIDTPEAFKRLVRGFYQGSHLEHPSQADWIRSRAEALNYDDRIAARAFLLTLIDTATEDDLQAAWRSGGSDYLVQPVRPLFKQLCELLRKTGRKPQPRTKPKRK